MFFGTTPNHRLLVSSDVDGVSHDLTARDSSPRFPDHPSGGPADAGPSTLS